ncbi:MAG: class I adenylate-forming enzyme family protein [Acidimicrobiia bacterium]|jgi:acyl-CoA synthetase (AMP-forming)/AMP-acid ligase II
MATADLGIPARSADLTLGRFLAAVVARSPDREALVTPNARLTYADLGARVRQAADDLAARGVGPGSRVALLLGNTVEFVVKYFAVTAIGGVAVPLSTYATADELDDLLVRSEAEHLVVRDRLAARRYPEELATGRWWPRCASVFVVGADGDPTAWTSTVAADAAAGDGYDRRVAGVAPEDDAVIVWTSGSTARPKGVVHRHQAVVVQSWRWADQLRLDGSDRIFTAYPLFWTAGLATALGGALAGGSTLVMVDVVEPHATVDLIARERVTTLLVPLHVDVELAECARRERRDLSSIRRVRRGSKLGELAGADADAWDPGGGYGLTEAFTIVAHLPADAPLDERRGTHGRPLPGTEVRIVDPESGEPLPAGAVGEIAVCGVTLMRGYVGEDPAATFDPDGFFHAQDLGYLDESGCLHWEGRASAMVRTRGVNVSPVEVERAVVDWGRLKVAKVVGVPHPVYGEAVVLCAVQRDDEVTEAEVRDALAARLAPYKVPARVLFFAAADLDFTDTQKLRADQLRRLAVRRIVDEAADYGWTEFLREGTT